MSTLREKLPKHANYCGTCGKKVTAAQDETISANGKKRTGRKHWGLVAVLGVAALLAGAAWILRSGHQVESYDQDASLFSAEKSSLSLLDVSMLDQKITDSDTALEALDSLSAVLPLDEAENELTIKNENTIQGTTYYRFQQVYAGIPVYGRTW